MINKRKIITSEISAGELLDKISILEIKLYKIKNKNSHNQVNKEYKILNKVKHSNIKLTTKIKKLIKEIKKVNLNLWNIEDEIRVHEKNKDFRLKFIKLARSVYLNNDKRAKIKSQINKISKSNINEVKQYIKY
jgi:adenine C2-methylase RlmN of 23S rRNA A2503 and tRNA A37